MRSRDDINPSMITFDYQVFLLRKWSWILFTIWPFSVHLFCFIFRQFFSSVIFPFDSLMKDYLVIVSPRKKAKPRQKKKSQKEEKKRKRRKKKLKAKNITLIALIQLIIMILHVKFTDERRLKKGKELDSLLYLD